MPAKTIEAMQLTAFRLPKGLFDQLRKESKTTGISMSEIMRLALLAYIEEGEK